ncbi:hypothetical protein [Jatrophihabitans endophyticus]|uniref:hypothetical protein n=1 Tax=Jatrophihabitans endophyticus TaxID=1206085 RepID=UPI00116149CD|nr:hypothetical protein [Jatrophihabitans endophyticus]
MVRFFLLPMGVAAGLLSACTSAPTHRSAGPPATKQTCAWGAGALSAPDRAFAVNGAQSRNFDAYELVELSSGRVLDSCASGSWSPWG